MKRALDVGFGSGTPAGSTTAEGAVTRALDVGFGSGTPAGWTKAEGTR